MFKLGAVPASAGRLVLLAIVAAVWAVVIFCRLVYFQVVAHPIYKAAAERQQERTVSLAAPRGTIFDRNGKPLAISVPVDSVCVNPLQVPDRAMAAELLARVLSGVNAGQLLQKMNAAVDEYRRLGKKARGVGFLWVKRKITYQESEAVRSLKLDWIEFRQESQRFYPDGPLAAHVLGGVDFEERGNGGLERRLDSELRGRTGKARVISDVAHRGIESTVWTEAQPGKSITTTLDERIQFVLDRELKAACELYSAHTGSAVVMEPHTGEVLAMSSYPNFDPNEPPKPGEKKEVRFNHPVSVAFEPGSVFKVVTIATGFETTNLNPETQINCGGGTFTLFGRTIHEARNGYRVLSVADVLGKSSNIGATQVALKVGKENLHRYVRLFGFGERTGIPLPAESFGSIRRPEVWHPAAIASIAMGHEISATTLQLAQAGSIIANGGVMVRPRLIQSRQRPGGPVEKEPAAEPKRVLKAETAITMRRLLENAVLHGTGRAARLTGYTAGGKTGSAQIFDPVTRTYTHTYNGSFLGFAPVTNPRIVVVITLNGVKLFGGVVAAPVFKAVATEALRILQVPKDLPDDLPPVPEDPQELNDLAEAEGSEPPDDLVALLPPAGPVPPPVEVLALGPRVPAFHGKTMRSVLEESLKAGVPVEVVGSGIARAQRPAPGAVLSTGERVRVEFR